MEFLLPGPEVTHTRVLREKSNGPSRFGSLPPSWLGRDYLPVFVPTLAAGSKRRPALFKVT